MEWLLLSSFATEKEKEYLRHGYLQTPHFLSPPLFPFSSFSSLHLPLLNNGVTLQGDLIILLELHPCHSYRSSINILDRDDILSNEKKKKEAKIVQVKQNVHL